MPITAIISALCVLATLPGSTAYGLIRSRGKPELAINRLTDSVFCFASAGGMCLKV